jgi:protein-S-isoprenylcysteine O-methyltransferase Ste14
MPQPAEISAATSKAIRQGLILLTLLSAILLGASADPTWPAAWLFLAVFAACQFLAFRSMRRRPDLLLERSKIQPGTAPWDRLILALVAFILPLLTWTAAALDHRFGWTGGIHPAWTAAGLVLVLAGLRLTQLAIDANRFFSATVRIQSDRAHTVVSDGPYAYVRHPGYAGLLAFTLGTPLALGSLRALIPAALSGIVLIVRTILEDRTLRAELAGYIEYSRRVRCRLVPLLW